MRESFDAYRYIGYLRSRWRWIGASCGIAVAIALAVTLLQPRQYTATARIVIDPPAGADLRAAMAVSPVYLESLKTYEQIASGDSLFEQAVQQFGLRSSMGQGALESLKKRVLKVGLVRNTRILEISGTLPDPHQAQAITQFIAESTVKLTKSIVSEGDQDLLRGISQQEHDIRLLVQGTEAAWAKSLQDEPVNQLQSDMKSAAELRAQVQQQVLSAELEIADAADREKRAAPSEVAEIRKEAASAKARLDEMNKQLQTIDRQNAEREKLIAVRSAHREKLDVERKSGQTALAAIQNRMREAAGDAGYRGERLRIIDPGVVPERPSSPNLPLNLVAALLIGLVLPILYLTLLMGYQEQRATAHRNVSRSIESLR